jgi:hypothetical protein
MSQSSNDSLDTIEDKTLYEVYRAVGEGLGNQVSNAAVRIFVESLSVMVASRRGERSARQSALPARPRIPSQRPF